MSPLDKSHIILGAGGHARVLIDILQLSNKKLICVLTPDTKLWGKRINNIPITGGDEYIDHYSPDEILIVKKTL